MRKGFITIVGGAVLIITGYVLNSAIHQGYFHDLTKCRPFNSTEWICPALGEQYPASLPLPATTPRPAGE